VEKIGIDKTYRRRKRSATKEGERKKRDRGRRKERFVKERETVWEYKKIKKERQLERTEKERII
jgi:hypothetical protein